MQDLIARLEAATEGSRELDADIALVNGWEKVDPFSEDVCGPPWRQIATGYRTMSCPEFSTSLDAALTLVPEEEKGSFTLHVFEGGESAQAHVGEFEQGDAKTGPLALCIAALKARSAT